LMIQDAKVRLYEWDGKELKEIATLSEENKSLVSALAFSPDGKFLASGDVSVRFIIYDPVTWFFFPMTCFPSSYYLSIHSQTLNDMKY
jgi:WD40 repeat protein